MRSVKLPPLELVRHLAMYLPRRLWLWKLVKKTPSLETRGRKVVVILSSDTEFDPPLRNGTWKKRSSSSLLDGLPRFLDMCDFCGASATLFCEGKLVGDFPDLFRDLYRHHEIGCHSFAHEWLGSRPPPMWIPRRDELEVLSTDAKTRILMRAVESIEKTIGNKPRSFKAPFNSIDHPSTLSLLDKIGFDADSSLASYNTMSFMRPILPSPARHTSSRNLWAEGMMHLVEVPFTIRPRPLFLHPFDIREGVIQTIFRSMKLALESVDIQCRLDLLSGRDFSVMHFASHPWEFSKIPPSGGNGKENARNLTRFMETLMALYHVEFLTISDFVRRWDSEYCLTHSAASLIREELDRGHAPSWKMLSI